MCSGESAVTLCLSALYVHHLQSHNTTVVVCNRSITSQMQLAAELFSSLYASSLYNEIALAAAAAAVLRRRSLGIMECLPDVVVVVVA